MMKRLIGLLLTIAMIGFNLAACTDDKPEDQNKPGDTSGENTPENNPGENDNNKPTEDENEPNKGDNPDKPNDEENTDKTDGFKPNEDGSIVLPDVPFGN